MSLAKRHASLVRKTKETDIRLSLNLDGQGKNKFALGIPFLEHMLDLLASHGRFDLVIQAKGDLEVDQHHLVEDVGICLGKALAQALGDKRGIVRYGACLLPMDESLVEVSLDLSGRPFLAYGLKLRQRRLADFDTELAVEFLRAFVQAGGITLHIQQRAGGNTHHLVEALFKGLGRALAVAVSRDPRVKGVPSTKGRL